jgi:catechol 2,3-dioxygenase-like lactoylglutathione lyase family enzyme
VPDVFDHVTLRVSDLEASRRFYERALAQLG